MTSHLDSFDGAESSSSVAGKSPMCPPIPDSHYYFKIVVFQVGNSLFRVPSKGFEVTGTPFEPMFSLPPGDDGHLEGSCDTDPIVLLVDVDCFRGLLGAMYPFHNGHKMTNTDWIGALDLATMWMFQEIRDEAIEKLTAYVQGKSPKEAILFAKKYRVLNWLKDGYSRLLQQATLTTPDLTEDPALDWETVGRLLAVKIQATRSDHHRCLYCGSTSYLDCSSNQQVLQQLMDQEFREEFNAMVPAQSNDPPLPDNLVISTSPPALEEQVTVLSGGKKKKKKHLSSAD